MPQRSPYACRMSGGSCPTVIKRTIAHNGWRNHGIIGLTGRIASDALRKNPLDGMVQAIDVTSHLVGLVSGAKDQDRHALNGPVHASKGVFGETAMVKGSLSHFGMGGLH